MAVGVAPKCSNVGCEFSTSKRCAGCIEGVDIDGEPSPIFYCSASCQREHWPEHKPACKAANHRKQLYRAGKLLQKIYLRSRESAFDMDVKKVEEKDGLLYLEWGTLKGDAILVNGPKDMCSKESDYHAVLTVNSCMEAMARMHSYLAGALRGSAAHSDLASADADKYPDCCTKIEEVRLVAKKERNYVIQVGGDIPGLTMHEVFKVHLKDGEGYAFDFTGAQYGVERTVTPWNEYAFSVAARMLDYYPCGRAASKMEESYASIWEKHAEGTPIDPRSRFVLTNQIQTHVSSVLKVAVMSWENQTRELASIVQLKQVNFEQHMSGILTHVRSSLGSFTGWLKTNGRAATLADEPYILKLFGRWELKQLDVVDDPVAAIGLLEKNLEEMKIEGVFGSESAKLDFNTQDAQVLRAGVKFMSMALDENSVFSGSNVV